MSNNFNLEDYKVESISSSAYYVREWVTRAEEEALLARVYGAPRPRWTAVAGRRLQNWGGVPHSRGMLPEPLPAWLTALLGRVHETGALPPHRAPNHALVNEYLPGQGIMPHEDGALFHPAVATLSLGGSVVLRLWTRGEEGAGEPSGALLLEPRSLLVLRDDLYSHHLHGIESTLEDEVDERVRNLPLCSSPPAPTPALVPRRHTRVSITMRHVLRTARCTLALATRA